MFPRFHTYNNTLTYMRGVKNMSTHTLYAHTGVEIVSVLKYKN